MASAVAAVPDDRPLLVDTDAGFREVLDALAEAPIYAFDTEFHRERTYYPQLGLVQLAWPGRLALVDPQAVDVAPLAAIFANGRTAVVHAAEQDLEILHQACGVVPRRLFDTQVGAGFLGFSSPSLVNLVQRLLRRTLAKGDRLSDWTRRPLTDAQCRYAASDVAHLLELHAAVVQRLRSCRRLEWAEQECATLLARSRPAQDPETAWWRIKDSRSLRGPARGVAQALAAWRERTAAALDRPPRSVLPDLAVLGMAHNPPRHEGAVREARGIDGRHLKGGAAAEILAAVRAGLALPHDRIKLPPVEELDRQLRPAVSLVSAWVSQLARDLRIDASLLATRNDLQALVRGEPDARLASGWRAELIGEPVRRLLGGDAALAFQAGTGDLVLEARSRQPFVVDAPVPDEDFMEPEAEAGSP